jgi:hypothetical protein
MRLKHIQSSSLKKGGSGSLVLAAPWMLPWGLTRAPWVSWVSAPPCQGSVGTA